MPNQATPLAGAGPVAKLDVAIARARELLPHHPELADEQAREILRILPGHAGMLTLRGRALAALGRIDEAVTVLRDATKRDPSSAEAWRELADQLVLSGDQTGADRAYARQIRASVHDPVLVEAAIALCNDDLSVAERLLKPHLKAHPTDVAAVRMLAELAARIGRYRDARLLLERAIELAPSFTAARFNLATVHYRQGQTVEALSVLEHLLRAEPSNPAYRNLAAAALTRIGELDDAIVHFEQVLAYNPANAKVWMSYGHALKTVGRRKDSIAAYRRSIAQHRSFGEAYWSLANLKTGQLGAEDIAAMEAALAIPILAVEDNYHLHFALGKAYEDDGQDEPAFQHYAAGNALRLSVIHYDPQETSTQVDRAIALFTPELLSARGSQGSLAQDPIFIVGMPRAGSTLIEQILASHPQVEGTHELPDIQKIARRIGGENGESYPESIAHLDGSALRALGEEYLDRTRIHRKTNRPYFVDKMPNNWAQIALIRLILPNAKIIDARRQPLGCCFSNFKQHFARGQAFSYSLDHLGRYYRDYQRLMTHFDAVAPGHIHRVDYERIVEDTETEVRRLLDYLGLPFDPACLRFHETERAVRTASSEQVRQPIFRDGLDQWRRFSRWLGPLRAALKLAPPEDEHGF